MTIKQNIINILDELKRNEAIINENDFQHILYDILNANHIFLSGKGRSGLVISAFANRLMHLGLSVSLVGEITSPHTIKNDLLILSSGSGETKSLFSIITVAKKENVKVVLFTTNPSSSLAKMADTCIIIPGSSKLTNKSIQPMASAFEQLCFIVYDAIILELMNALNQNTEQMFSRHANFE